MGKKRIAKIGITENVEDYWHRERPRTTSKNMWTNEKQSTGIDLPQQTAVIETEEWTTI